MFLLLWAVSSIVAYIEKQVSTTAPISEIQSTWDPAITLTARRSKRERSTVLGQHSGRRLLCKVDCVGWSTCRRSTLLVGRLLQL